MKPGEYKQHVPVFVGSTFEDLKDYRRAVRDSLSQLEIIVRGMEYFGSKPGSPVEECLAAVRSCKVYVGVFGMRYGTIPEGHDRSMTHLEYDEAQKFKLPSLIYIIDEETQPLLPKYVEKGAGAEALFAFKELLRKRHVISTFTTPDDLAKKVLHDFPELLRTIGARIEGELPHLETTDSLEIIRRFRLLPKMHMGREVTIEIRIEHDFHSVNANECEELRLDEGATIRGHATLVDGSGLWVYVCGDLAERMLDIKSGSSIVVGGVTVYGTTHEDYIYDTVTEHEGIRINRIAGVTSTSKKGAS